MPRSSNALRRWLVEVAVLLALAAGGCGRTTLDASVDVTGTAGTAGTAGTWGIGGGVGAAGRQGTAGDFGTAGAGGAAGTSGAKCVPGSTTCATGTSVQSCGPNGVWQPAQTCAGTCLDGACRACAEGTTRCTSREAEQTCKGGQWSPAAACPFVCVNDACGTNPKHVFATSKAFVAGKLGGLSGADDICRRLAVDAGLSSSYAAWLSDGTGSPVSRFPKDGGPYVLVDGTIVANNWTHLTSGTLRHPIDLNEMGGPPAQRIQSVTSKAVWTNTTASGTPSATIFATASSCNDWSDPMGTSVVFGSIELSTKGWSELGYESSGPGVAPTVCEGAAALYCFEQ
jgi:hypothetical protein